MATKAETDRTPTAEEDMRAMARAARRACQSLALAEVERKNRALRGAAEAIRARSDDILDANAIDLEAAGQAGISAAMIDRLTLTEDRIEAMAAGLETIAGLDDPLGRVLRRWSRPNGLEISQISVSLGVIGIIYESRPNVTADAGGLCLKAGNAAILRGGSEARQSNRAVHACLVDGLVQAGLPAEAIQLVQTTDRAAVGAMLALPELIDVIVPRGGKSLIARVQADSRVPVLAHLDGVCHVYVDGEADAETARKIAVNAKMRRPGICGAAETLLVDRAAVDQLPDIAADLSGAGCELRGDEAARAAVPDMTPADEKDWSREYLDPVLSVAVVDGVDGAIAHIAQYGSGHTDSIVTEDAETAEKFLSQVDSAIVLHNASTQFADGGEFGFGAEIGIATGRLHARGPVGLEQLTTYKYLLRGTGQTRP